MKTFSKEIWRSITHSASRFWAIFAIVALGAGFFAGLRAAAPDMRATGDAYYDSSNLMDIRVVSTLGLTDSDIDAVKNTPGVKSVMPAHYADIISKIAGMDQTIRVHSIPSGGPAAANESDMNRPTLVSGRWPQNAGECVVGAKRVNQSNVKIGDTIQVSAQDGSQRDQLKYGSFKIVGIVTSSYYICFNLGTTTIGNGELNYFVYIRNEDFNQSVYTELFATVNGAKQLNCFSNEYDDTVKPVVTSLKDLAKSREEIRYQDVYSDAKSELDKGKTEYNTKKADADKQLNDAAKKISDGEKSIADNEKQLANAEKQTADGEKKLVNGQNELSANEKLIMQNRSKLTQAEQSLAASAQQWESGTAALNAQKAQVQSQLSQAQAAIGSGLPGTPATQQEFEQMRAAAEQKLAAAQQQLDAAKAQIDAGSQTLSTNKAQLDAAQKNLDAGKKELNTSRATLSAARAQIASGTKQLAQAKADLAKGKSEYEQNKAEADQKLADAAKKISDGEAELKKLEKPEWYVLDRGTNVGFASFRGDADRMDSLSTVFPLIFFLVAALVALTTMTRMVEEERILIGTYKALGYSNAKIASKYIIYAALASVFGSIAGISIGFQILPQVVWKAYGILYTAPALMMPLNLSYALTASLAAIFCTLAATWAACRSTLAESPANLMLPRAPKAGKRILLERIKPIWSHISFIQKVTARNLFLYKKRFLMTVIGIAGCTALLVTGYGIKDSVSEIISKQFDEVYNYNTTVGLKGSELKSGLSDLLNDKNNFKDWIKVSSKTTDVTAGGKTVSASLFVPENPGRLKTFINLRDRRTQRDVPFGDNSVVLTEKLSSLLGVGVGGSITVKNSGGQSVTFRVTGVTEHYVYHYVYISPALYESKMGEAPVYNEAEAICTVTGAAQRKALSAKIMAQDGVGTFTYMDEMTSKYDTMIQSMNMIVFVLIISAGLLAFIVLYNLTNINVTERQRELATIKVLGFYDGEVGAYIFRETTLLTVIGCVLGLGLGILMHLFVVRTAEVDMMMFGRIIKPMSYVWSAAFTMLFGVAVDLVMYRKLKKIDMVESLKSVD